MKRPFFLLKLVGLSMLISTLLPVPAFAISLLEKRPSTHLDGVQSDPGTSPWSESLIIEGPADIAKISWWGYYLENTENAEAGNYQFSVDLGGNGPLPGTVNRSLYSTITDINDPQLSLNLYLYELNLSGLSFAGGSTTLEISNNSQDVIWLWQGINGNERAFLLTPVPEANIYVMFIAGLGLLGFMARGRTDI